VTLADLAGLDAYRSSKLVVLPLTATAAEAARVMLDNHVGAVLVSARDGLAGVVTDRDLAVSIVSEGADPARVALRDLMSDELAVIDVRATVDDVLQLMRSSGCRRVPIADAGVLVGLVTLDDLLLDGRIDAAGAAAVLRAQLDSWPRARDAHGPQARRAYVARAEATYARWLESVAWRWGMTPTRAEGTARALVGAICRGVDAGDAMAFAAHLPTLLCEDALSRVDGPPVAIELDAIVGEVVAILGVRAEVAEVLLGCIGEVLAEDVPRRELAAVRRQLPPEVSKLLHVAPREVARRPPLHRITAAA
jgi:CBS domain-containing protein/uncharacterized protein (DUF2267 family)